MHVDVVEQVEKATAVVHGVIKGIPIPFPLDNPNACENSGLVCPLKPNKADSYTTVLQIKSMYPSVSKLGQYSFQLGLF